MPFKPPFWLRKRVRWLRRARSSLALLFILIWTLCMAAFAFSYGGYHRHKIRHEVKAYGAFLAGSLWHMDQLQADRYLELILQEEDWCVAKVYQEDESVFADRENHSEHSLLDYVLQNLGMIRHREYEVALRFQNQPVGRFLVNRVDRIMYTYATVGTLFGVLLIAAYLLIALRETRTRYRQIVESVGDIIFETDLQGRFTYVNRVAKRITGYRRDELRGSSFIRLVDQIQRRSAWKFYQNQLKNGPAETYLEFPIRTKAGELRWIGQHAHLTRQRGVPTGIRAVARDITELHNSMDALAERDRQTRQEMDLARRIHHTLLPTPLPRLPGLELGLKLVPSADIGGDFVDIHHRPDHGQVQVFFADVTGHGTGAALLASMLKVLVGDLHRFTPPPEIRIANLNRRLHREFPEGHFASAFYAEFDAAAQQLRYVKAAQEPAIFLRPGQPPQVILEGGPVLGLFDPEYYGEPDYRCECIALQPGDTLVLYTDGILDLVDGEHHRPIPREQLIEWLQESQELSPQALVEHIYQQVLAYFPHAEQEDDMALMAIRYTG